MIIDPPGTRRERPSRPPRLPAAKVVRKQLPNGLTVLLKQDSSTPTVSIQAFCFGGAASDTPETSGLAALACETMTRGTQKYDARQIAEYFDSIGGMLSVDSQRFTSFLQCAVLKPDFATSLDYVYQILFAPTFPEDEFDKVRQQQLARIAARKANPQTEIVDFWTKQLPRQSPYGRTVLGSGRHGRQADGRRIAGSSTSSISCRTTWCWPIYGDIDPPATLAATGKVVRCRSPRRTTFQRPRYLAAADAGQGRHGQPAHAPGRHGHGADQLPDGVRPGREDPRGAGRAERHPDGRRRGGRAAVPGTARPAAGLLRHRHGADRTGAGLLPVPGPDASPDGPGSGRPDPGEHQGHPRRSAPGPRVRNWPSRS